MNCEVSSLGKKKPNGIGSRIGHVSQCNTDASSVPRYVNTSNKSHCVQPTSFFSNFLTNSYVYGLWLLYNMRSLNLMISSELKMKKKLEKTFEIFLVKPFKQITIFCVLNYIYFLHFVAMKVSFDLSILDLIELKISISEKNVLQSCFTLYF